MTDKIPEHQPELAETENISEKPKAARRVFGWKKIALVGLSVLAGRGALALPGDFNSDKNTDSPSPIPTETVMPTPASTPSEEERLTDPDSIERLEMEKAIEKKYGIEFITLEEAAPLVGIDYNTLDMSNIPTSPEVRWSTGDLRFYDEMFSLIPATLYEPINGKDVKLFKDSYIETNTCTCKAVSYGDTGVIGLDESTMGEQNRARTFSALVHELTHRADALTNNVLQQNVKQIIGERLTELKSLENASDFISENAGGADGFDAIESLADFDTVGLPGDRTNEHGHQSIVEGVAILSQMYITGYDDFLKDLGPVLDGEGDSAKVLDPSLSLAENFPKTQALYELYRNEIFGGKEYDQKTIDEINIGKDNAEFFYNLKINYGLELDDKSQSVFVDKDLANRIRSIISLFPKDFYSAFQGKKIIYAIEPDSSLDVGDSLVIYQTTLDNRSLFPGINVSDGVLELAGELLVKKDEENGHNTQDEILRILGGDKFLNSAQDLYPSIGSLRNNNDAWTQLFFSNKRHINPSALTSTFGEAYLGGWQYFKSLGRIFDPGINMYDPNQDYSKTKTGQIYEALKSIYEGIEFNSYYVAPGVPGTSD